MAPSNFDEVLGLEEEFYKVGLEQGLDDGIKSGRLEGRTFGLEKGFEKFGDSSRLYGKSIIWANRLSKPTPNLEDSTSTFPFLSEHLRLQQHIKVLHALSESATFSTSNSEEAVSDFDDRLKRARAKAKIIERIVREAPAESERKLKS